MVKASVDSFSLSYLLQSVSWAYSWDIHNLLEAFWRSAIAIHTQRRVWHRQWAHIHTHHTSNDGRKRWSFSTTTSFLTSALSRDLVSAPGPGPTSHTQQPPTSPATRTILSTSNYATYIIYRCELTWFSCTYVYAYVSCISPVIFRSSRKFWLSWDLALRPYNLMMSPTVGNGGSLLGIATSSTTLYQSSIIFLKMADFYMYV